MDKERRSRLKRIVTQARKVVEEDVRVQLRRLGFDESGKVKSMEELPHLSSEDRELRDKILEAVEKEKTSGISDRDAFDRYVRHVGFTYVNRIAALRAMEVRKLIKKETVLRRDVYGDRSRREYEIAEREGIVDPYRLLKASLVEAFREVSAEIKVLFDVNSEYSLVFLGHKALLELVRLLSEEVPDENWKEDDIIGWIYQYYNDEAREKFRKEKRKPNADDIPVINQFYTPRWIVRALVDNTLGRLWLEMNGRCPKPGDPTKRTKEHLDNTSGDKVDEFCSYLLPLSQEPTPREKKGVREIRVMDPACGSGHFLVYAFDVLYRMYMEDEPETSTEEIPRLILEHNLYGIDIDLRAVQLAALSLYLKAKSYNPNLKIAKMNLICADARISDGKARKAFLERFSADPELQKIFARIFEDLEYTFEVGSLLKVRGPFEKLLERRRKEGIQAVLFPRVAGQTVISKSGKIEGQTELAMSVSEKNEQQETILIPKAVTLNQMIKTLKEFENEAMEKRDMGTLLFATEVEKSVGLLALLSQRYDVVFMNPPYGPMPSETKRYLRQHFPKTHHDYYAAFIEQAIDLINQGGYVGVLVGRSFMFLKKFRWVRENLLRRQARPEIVLDLGLGVYVARYNWTAFTARKRTSYNEELTDREQIAFIRLTEMPDETSKRAVWEEVVSKTREDKKHPLFYVTTSEQLSKIPGMPFSYWTTDTLRAVFTECPPLDRDLARRRGQPKIADVRQGLATADDYRFSRFWWEVPVEQIGTSHRETFKGKKWAPYANEVLLFYFFADVQRVVNWGNCGEEIKNYVNRKTGRPYSNVWMLKGTERKFFFHEGITWSVSINKSQLDKVKQIQRIPFRILPAGCVFGVAAQGIFSSAEKVWPLLAVCCSKLMYYLSRLVVAEKMPGTGPTASLPIAPSLNLLDESAKKIGLLAQEAHDLLREWSTGHEISTLFIKPWILQIYYGFNSSERPSTLHPLAHQFEWTEWTSVKDIRAIKGQANTSLRELADLCARRLQKLDERLNWIQNKIDEETYRAYNISNEDRASIEQELALRQGTKTEKKHADQFPVEDYVKRLLSYYVKKAIESDNDGIVPVYQPFEDNLMNKVRELIALDFGKDHIDQIENEIEQILGGPLTTWIAKEFFDFHVTLYRWRPIFWHLTSSNFTRVRGSAGAFNCFLHYHKLDRDTIPKIMTKYLRPELDRAKWKVDRLKREVQEARDANDKRKERRISEELDPALSILEELQSFQKALEEVHNSRKEKMKLPKNARWVDQKIAEVRDNGYNPVIDYGVRVNIEPLKEAGLLHKAARRVK